MTNISPELAEICGIHTGDGYLRCGHRNELDISGNTEEKGYYDNHIKNLFKVAFGIEIKCRFFKHRNTYGFVVRDKKIIKFMHELGFPYGNKSLTVRIPELILNNKDEVVISNFIRGLFDTDGCLHFWKRTGNYSNFKKTHSYYPIIAFSTVSEDLNKDLLKILSRIGFEKIGNYTQQPREKNEKKKYVTRIYGNKNILLFFDKIGSKNPVKLSRFLVWKKLGYCQANTTLKQRLELLKSQETCNLQGP